MTIENMRHSFTTSSLAADGEVENSRTSSGTQT